MQKNYRYVANFIMALLVISQFCHCNKPLPPPTPLTTGDWMRKAEFDGVPRSEAVAFTIGDTAYVGTGYDGTHRLTDFWGYEAKLNAWVQRADFPGTARNSAVAFTIGNQGYVGTGYDGANLLNDFYRFNPTNNTWDTIAPFGGNARFDAVGFGLGNFGYVTTGFDVNTYYNDFWQFDPSKGVKGTWVRKTDFSGQPRSAAVALVYGNKAYIVTGSNNGTPCGDFWYYDATADEWVRLRNIYNYDSLQTYDDDYTDIERDDAVGFVIGNSAYLVTGDNVGGVISTWGYSFAQDKWVRRSPLPMQSQGSVAFSINGYGYVATGKSGSSTTGYLDVLVQFNPNQTLNKSDY